MSLWKTGCLGLALTTALTGQGLAQVPAAPAVPATAAVTTPAAGPPMPVGLIGNLCKNYEYCKEKFCKTQLATFLNNGLAPVSILSGGIIGSCCPTVSATDLAKPADSAEGAAARIKADEAAAAARRAAVRYLGTVDCHYWPEAQDALYNALRADRNECVRMEAAFVLGRGCCCTRKTIEGLSIVVSGSERDGNPAETSARVKQVARISLEHCLACRAGGHPEGHILPAPAAEDKPAPDEEGSLKKRPTELPSPGTADEVRSSSGNQVSSQAPAPLPPQTRRATNLFDLLSIKAAKRRNPVPPVSPPAVNPLTEETTPVETSSTETPPTTLPSEAAPVSTPPATVKPASLLLQDPARSQGEVQKTQAQVVASPAPPAAAPMPGYLPNMDRRAWSERSTAHAAQSTPSGVVGGTTYQPGMVRVPNPTYAMNRTMPLAPRPGHSCWQVPGESKDLPAQQLGPQATPVAIAHALAVLREAFSPEQRETAVLSLVGVNCEVHPQVIPALMKAARQDPAGMVRAACVRSLARLDINTIPMLAATPELQKETDPRVRHELDTALATEPST